MLSSREKERSFKYYMGNMTILNGCGYYFQKQCRKYKMTVEHVSKSQCDFKILIKIVCTQERKS